MSRIGGSSVQPEAVTFVARPTGAPQLGQVRSELSTIRWHHGHWDGAVFTAFSARGSVRLVVLVHRLDADPPGAGHAGEGEARAAEEADAKPLHLDVHRDAGVLVEEPSGLD